MGKGQRKRGEIVIFEEMRSHAVLKKGIVAIARRSAVTSLKPFSSALFSVLTLIQTVCDGSLHTCGADAATSIFHPQSLHHAVLLQQAQAHRHKQTFAAQLANTPRTRHTQITGCWSLNAPQHLQGKNAKLNLRGGGDADVQMEVDSAPSASASSEIKNKSGTGEKVDHDAPTNGLVNVTIKWKFKSFALEIDTWQSSDVLKSQLYSLTQVAPEDQFLIGIYQSGQDANLKQLDLKSSQTLILLGEPTRLPPPPQRFDIATNSVKRPAGLSQGSSTPGGQSGGGVCGMETDDDYDAVAQAYAGAAHADAPQVAAARDMEEEDEDVTAPKITLGESLPRRGFFSYVERARTEKQLAYLRELQENVTGMALQNVLPEIADAVNKSNLFSTSEAGAGGALQMEKELDSYNTDDARMTLPREFWHKKVTEYTDEERERLKSWLAATRKWHITTRQQILAKEEAEAKEEEEREVDDHQRLIDEHVEAHERELNKQGRSLERAREICMKGFDLFPLPFAEAETNETRANELQRIRADPALMEKELAGGLDCEEVPAWNEAVDWLDNFVTERMSITRAEALREHAEEEVKGAALDAELAEESEASLLDYEDEDVDAEEGMEDGEVVLEEAAAADGRITRRRKLSDVVTFGWEKDDMLPLGLENLGNTCYMASAVQVLRAVPELMRSILTHEPSDPKGARGDLQANLLEALRLLFFELTDKKESVQPYTAIHHLRQLVPQFAEAGPMGPAQQDAEECLSAIMQALDAKLGGVVRSLFEIELATSTRCAEEGASDGEVVSRERSMRLPLNIDAKTNVIHDAIRSSLNYEVTKASASLGRDAKFNVTAEIAKLPPYLAVQFVRFYWRKDTKKKAKICRNVYFPTVLDMLPYCTEGLRIPIEKELAARRAEYMRANPVYGKADDNDELALKWAQMDRDEAEEAERARQARLQAALLSGQDGIGLDEEMREELEVMRAEEAAAMRAPEQEASANATRAENGSARGSGAAGEEGEGRGSIKHSALYTLRAIITHQGRFADAGHYIAWVKTGIRQRLTDRGVPQPMWLKLDDEKTSLHTEEEVKRTAGGADGPIAYVCIYGRSSAVAEGISEQHQSRASDVY